jgi:hypothetical protein
MKAVVNLLITRVRTAHLTTSSSARTEHLTTSLSPGQLKYIGKIVYF